MILNLNLKIKKLNKFLLKMICYPIKKFLINKKTLFKIKIFILNQKIKDNHFQKIIFQQKLSYQKRMKNSNKKVNLQTLNKIKNLLKLIKQCKNSTPQIEI